MAIRANNILLPLFVAFLSVMNFILPISALNSILPIHFFLTQFPIIILAFMKGVREGLLALGFAGLMVVFVGADAALVFFFVCFLPLSFLFFIFLFPARASEGYGWPDIKMSMNRLFVIVIPLTLLMAYLYSPLEGAEGVLYIKTNIAAEMQKIASLAQDGFLDVKQILYIIPFLYMASMILLILLNAVVAQALLTRMGRAIRPSLQFQQLQISPFYSIFMILSIMLLWLSSGFINYIATNLSLLFYMLYLFVGLSVVHVYMNAYPSKKWLLIGFYIIFFLVLPVQLFVGCLGLLDDVFSLKKRMRNR